MNISDQVIKDILSTNLVSHELQLQLDEAMVENIKNQLLKDSDDDSLKLKYDKVSQYMKKSCITIDDIKMDLPKRREILAKKVVNVVKIVLNVLDTFWLIIKEFSIQKENDIILDNYYKSIVDSLLLKVKILHISVLIATYDDTLFIEALESLNQLLKERYTEAETNLKNINNQLKQYNDIGPEFETLKEAYKSLIYKIQATKDDIDRINNN